MSSYTDFQYMYIKLRREFGRHCNFDDVEGKIIAKIDRNKEKTDNYVARTINNYTFSNINKMSQHSVNTARVKIVSRGTYHREGGWPKEVDATEAQDVNKWRKKTEKDVEFLNAVNVLVGEATKCIEHNETIDMIEQYFVEEQKQQVNFDVPNCKVTSVFKDPTDDSGSRAISHISMLTDEKIVVCYSVLEFKNLSEDMNCSSYIWDINNPNVPCYELCSNSPLTTCRYYPKVSDILAAGCYNGVVQLYDTRKGSDPVAKSDVEHSHSDRVQDLCWIQSKAQEFVTTSNDGEVLWWDTRFMSEPRDRVQLGHGFGGSALEWMADAGPTKYLVGTEQGTIAQLTKKQKNKSIDFLWFGQDQGSHFSSIRSVKRNPHIPKLFLTAGDWQTKIWTEEIKTPIYTTSYAESMISGAAWSPTRPGLFCVYRQDGKMDFFDYFDSMDKVCLTQCVEDAVPLTAMEWDKSGKYIAVGDQNGTVKLLELSDSLSQPQYMEKQTIGEKLELETTREKNLEKSMKEAARAQKMATGAPKPEEDRNEAEEVREIEKQFAEILAEKNKSEV